jgi:hypothetical protein
MSTITDRLRQFVDDEMTFPGNPDVVCNELIAAMAEQIVRVRLLDDMDAGRIDPRKARDLFAGAREAAMKRRKQAVDPLCVDLAERFLRDVKDAGPEDIQELAEAIQRLCEDTCRFIKTGEESDDLDT